MKFQSIVWLLLIAVLLSACGRGASTPTKAVETFFDAVEKKDGDILRSVMPTEIASTAKIDEAYFKKLINPYRFTRKPDIREKIGSDGKTGVVEIQDDSETLTIHVVKEDNGWKLRADEWP